MAAEFPCAVCVENCIVLHIKVPLSVLLCAVKTVEGDFRFCWAISPKVEARGRILFLSNSSSL